MNGAPRHHAAARRGVVSWLIKFRAANSAICRIQILRFVRFGGDSGGCWRWVACSTQCYSQGMGEVISQRELRNDSGRIMRGLDEGRSFVVTRNAVPVGELRPLRRQRLVDVRLVAELFHGAPRVDATRFRRDLDDVVEQDAEPRA